MDRSAPARLGGGQRGCLAQQRRHRRAAGTAGAATGRRCECRARPIGTARTRCSTSSPAILAKRRRAPARPSSTACCAASTEVRAARPLRRTVARPSRRAPHRPQLLLRRHPRRADAHRLGAGPEIGRAHPACATSRITAPGRVAGALRLGHRQHAHRRRRHRAGAGADRRAARPGTGVPAACPATRSSRWPSSAAHASTSPSASPASSAMPSRPRSLCSTAPSAPSARSTSPRTATRSPPACAAECRGADRAKASTTPTARAGRPPHLRLKARRLRRGPAGADRRRGWRTKADLARAYLDWGQYAYGTAPPATPARPLRRPPTPIDAVVHNQDNREHDLLDSDDYYQFEGGLAATAKTLTGRKARRLPQRPFAPRAPGARRSRRRSPRSCAPASSIPNGSHGVKRHGYKGAFEIIATVDYMFAFAATTGAVKTHHFDLAFDAFVEDAATRDFIRAEQPLRLRRADRQIQRGAATAASGRRAPTPPTPCSASEPDRPMTDRAAPRRPT